jgi:nitroreductase
MATFRFVPLKFNTFSDKEICHRSKAFLDQMRTRRTVRDYSGKKISRGVIENVIQTAGTAPSGANMQPWHFVVVTKAETMSRIREAAEAEEHEFYTHRASKEWLGALAPLGTGEHKPFLESASCLIAVFLKKFSYDQNGGRLKNYYTSESVGIATGILITALHHAGIATLTHTPSPMRFLNNILQRPADERPYLLLVAGFPAEGANVPDIQRHELGEIATFVE